MMSSSETQHTRGLTCEEPAMSCVTQWEMSWMWMWARLKGSAWCRTVDSVSSCATPCDVTCPRFNSQCYFPEISEGWLPSSHDSELRNLPQSRHRHAARRDQWGKHKAFDTTWPTPRGFTDTHRHQTLLPVLAEEFLNKPDLHSEPLRLLCSQHNFGSFSSNHTHAELHVVLHRCFTSLMNFIQHYYIFLTVT